MYSFFFVQLSHCGAYRDDFHAELGQTVRIPLGNNFPALVLSPSITAGLMQITNQVMNLLYQTGPGFYSLAAS